MDSDDDTHCWVGFPIRKFQDQSLLAAPLDLSQRATSFIASQCQGIHQMPLRYVIAPRTLWVNTKILVPKTGEAIHHGATSVAQTRWLASHLVPFSLPHAGVNSKTPTWTKPIRFKTLRCRIEICNASSTLRPSLLRLTPKTRSILLTQCLPCPAVSFKAEHRSQKTPLHHVQDPKSVLKTLLVTSHPRRIILRPKATGTRRNSFAT